MSTATRRRPLPALAFLLALSALTGIVWWRVLHRPEPSDNASSPLPTQSSQCAPGSKAIRLPTPAAVTVTVLNGAGRDRLATQVTGQLKSRGFKVGTPGTTSALTGVAEIRFGAAGRAGATLLSYHLPGSKLAPGNRSGAQVEVVLGAAYKSLATTETASRAVAAATGKSC
ncbi:MAG: LytR C-terminal domain-containing protein [Jatrophihabitantaceae bacterium]